MRKLLILSAVVLSATNPAAFGGTVMGNGGATEVTQFANNIEMVSQTAQQIQMVQNQLTSLSNQAKNLTSSPQQIWGQASGELQQLASLVAQGQSLSYTAGNIDQLFKQQYPGYGKSTTSANYTEQYQIWSQNSLGGINTALQAAGFQSRQFANEQAALDSIKGISAGSPGSLQAIQAGNMIASQQVSQLQKLRQLQMAQMQAQGNYLAGQQSKQDNDTEAVQTWMKQGNGKVRDWGQSGFVGFGTSVQ